MKDKLKKIVNLNLENVRKVPLTIIFSLIFAIIISVNPLFDNNYILNKLLYIRWFLILIIVNLFLVEVSFKHKKNKVIGYVLSFIVATLLNHLSSFYLLLNSKCDIDCSTDFSIYMKYVTIGYILAVVSISIFIIYKKLKISFSKYVNIVLSNLFKTGIIFFTGVIGISFIVVWLEIIVDADYKLFEVLYSLLFGLYLIPNVIISFIDTNKEKIITLFKTVSNFCILPVTIISILIIYFYIFKILITKIMPENLIFMLVALVFIIGMISYFSSINSENKILKIYSKSLAYMFILPIILQIYSVSIRFIEYGLTPDRYITYMFIVFEIITIFLLIYKKGLKLPNILLAFSIICIITTVGPFNLVRMSYINQASILNKYYNTTGDKYSKAVSAYKYLNQTGKGKEYISDEVKNSNINDEILDKYPSSNTKSYNLKIDYENIDIHDYKTMAPVRISKNSSNYVITNIITNNKVYDIDISGYIDDVIKNDYIDDFYFNENNTYKINDNEELYLYRLYIRVDKDTDEILSMTANGYILKK